jgi:alkanesulfonate monooxygenase SsuD/methylene tetrahydromethanopterin reductase-like flavin-dependent oxidoreductase (luciferase family)
MQAAPMAAGSVSLRLYPHNELPPEGIVETLRGQAQAARDAGFDGVMTSEHHNGFAGYLPNPLQAAGWVLEAMHGGWAAPCPLLLTLRPTALVIEETAWLGARFPGRVGLGVAAGSLADDFEVMEADRDDRAERFARGLETVAAALSGRDPGPLHSDPAVLACRALPIPVTSAAMSVAAVRRAARLAVGVVFDSLSGVERCRQLSNAYREAGGPGPVVMIRRVLMGARPSERHARQLARYRGYAEPSAQAHWTGDQLVNGDDPGWVAEQLAGAALAGGAQALNLRVHVPGLTPGEVMAQIQALADVVEAVRPRLQGWQPGVGGDDRVDAEDGRRAPPKSR